MASSASVKAFDYVQHPHIAAREAAGPPTTAAATHKVHGASALGRLNERVGLKVTMVVGTMWCAYAFAVLTFVSFPQALKAGMHGDLVTFVAWIAQTFLQLVLLPIIIVGQNVLAKAADARAQATFDDATAVLEEARQIQAHLASQDEAIQKILDSLNRP